MFEDSLVESSGKLAARHPFATVVSFAGQIIALSALLLLSLLYTETLPTQRWINVLQAPPPPPSAPASRSVAIASNRSGALSDPLVVPSEIPKSIGMVRTERTAPGTPPSGIAGDILGSVPENSIGIVNSLLRPATPVLPRLAPQKVRVSSGVAEGMLIHQVKPPYPVAAKMARVEGSVALQAVIGKDGSIQNLRVISGHPLLTSAALEAVKQWRYKPYYLNGEPVEVETQIVVNFLLTHD
jgi:protein TonB